MEVFPAVHLCDRFECVAGLSVEYSFYKKPCSFLPSMFDVDESAGYKAPIRSISSFKQRIGVSGHTSGSLRMRNDRFPFPSLWSNVLNQWEAVSRLQVGFIRSWSVWKDDEGWKVRLEIGGNRWCLNMGRAHKSNHIYFILDLARSCFFQKCHDLDCAHFASSLFPLPREEAENASLYFDAEEMLNDGAIPPN